jgi:hypothetical protein
MSARTVPEAPTWCESQDWHGPRREHLDNICTNGLVATRTMDAGYFGSGCYYTLNIEYAIKYVHGVLD